MPVPGRPQVTVSTICSRVSSVFRNDSASPPYPPPPLPCHLWQPKQLARLNTALPASVGSADCAKAPAVVAAKAIAASASTAPKGVLLFRFIWLVRVGEENGRMEDDPIRPLVDCV